MDPEEAAALRVMTSEQRLCAWSGVHAHVRHFQIVSVRAHHPGWGEGKSNE